MPAILQDAKRARLMGIRTAGAGGIVTDLKFPNQFNISYLQVTKSIAYRADGTPIENNGVSPDVPYTPTVNDLQTGYSEFRDRINEEVGKLLETK